MMRKRFYLNTENPLALVKQNGLHWIYFAFIAGGVCTGVSLFSLFHACLGDSIPKGL